MCVLDEFSEYLLETRFNTSADFNTYPIRIFSIPQRYEIVNLVQVTCSNVNVITQKCSNIHLFVCVFMNILV